MKFKYFPIFATIFILMTLSQNLVSLELEKIKTYNLSGLPYTTEASKNIIYHEGKIIILAGTSTDTSAKTIGFIGVTDTLGTEYFNKYLISKEDTLRIDAKDIRVNKNNEIIVLLRKTTIFYVGKFNVFSGNSRLNIRKYDFNGNELFNYIDESDSNKTRYSPFGIRFNKNNEPVALYTPNTYNGKVNIQVNKYDKEGNLLFTKAVDTFEDGDDIIYTVEDFIVSEDGDYYGYGRRTAFAKNGGSDTLSAIAFKIDKDLNIVWKREFYPIDTNIGYFFQDLIEIDNGNLLFVNDEKIIEISKENNIIDSTNINSKYTDIWLYKAKEILTDSRANYYITGEANNNSYIAKLDDNKMLEWEYVRTTENKSRFSDIIEYKPNHYLLLETERESKRLNLYKFKDDITNVEREEVSDDIIIYPNPGYETVFIDLMLKAKKVQIYDNAGSLVRVINPANSDKFELDISDFSSGVYHLTFSTKKGNISKKLIIK